jgi:hypothetical protein
MILTYTKDFSFFQIHQILKEKISKLLEFYDEFQ